MGAWERSDPAFRAQRGAPRSTVAHDGPAKPREAAERSEESVVGAGRSLRGYRNPQWERGSEATRLSERSEAPRDRPSRTTDRRSPAKRPSEARSPSWGRVEVCGGIENPQWERGSEATRLSERSEAPRDRPSRTTDRRSPAKRPSEARSPSWVRVEVCGGIETRNGSVGAKRPGFPSAARRPAIDRRARRTGEAPRSGRAKRGVRRGCRSKFAGVSKPAMGAWERSDPAFRAQRGAPRSTVAHDGPAKPREAAERSEESVVGAGRNLRG